MGDMYNFRISRLSNTNSISSNCYYNNVVSYKIPNKYKNGVDNMDFNKAVKELTQNNYMRREDWTFDKHLGLKDNNELVVFRCNDPFGICTMFVDDMNAEDWIIDKRVDTLSSYMHEIEGINYVSVLNYAHYMNKLIASLDDNKQYHKNEIMQLIYSYTGMIIPDKKPIGKDNIKVKVNEIKA